MSTLCFVCVFLFILGTSVHMSDAVAFDATAAATVAELSTGTIITLTPTTAKAATANTLTCTITVTGPNSLDWFEVADDGSNCVVSKKSAATIDYESADLTSKTYPFTLTAAETDTSSVPVGATQTIVVTLTITDVVEFASLTPTIKENLAGGATVGTVSNSDTGTFTYAISSQSTDPGWMAIDSTSGAITVVSGQTVDYEESTLTSYKYEVVVVATKSDNTLSGTTTVTITITDTDDFASGLTAFVLTGTASPTTVTVVTTTPTSSAVALVSQTPDIGWFALDGKNVTVAATNVVNYLDTNLPADKTYRVVLTVGAAGSSQGTGTVTITVTQSGVSAMMGSVVLTLVSLLLFKFSI